MGTPTEDGLKAVDQSLAQATGQGLALLGARHDLTLAAEQPETCRCIAFGVGAPSDARFEWEGPKPQVRSDEQLVVAFRADPECLGGKPSPSYQGYATEGRNVMLLLEAVHPGRPELNGAIVPRPTGDGALLVKLSDPDLTFGQPLEESADRYCEVPFTGGPAAAKRASAR